MKKKLLFIVLMVSTQLFSQTKTITVDNSSIIGQGKKMTGVNTGPHSIISGTTEACLQSMGTELVRTHDYHGPCDFWDYTSFFDYPNQTFNYSFQSASPSDYDWTTTDAQISEITNANLQPFFRLGISFPGGGFSPASPMPKDADGINFHTFAGIAKRTAMHYTANWDNGFDHTIPYWEVWNEPNNGASWNIDSVTAYYRLYQQVTDSIKSFNPMLKVGGPAAAKNAFYTGGIHFTINQNYVSNFLGFCQSNAVPLDFYSFHMYDKKNPYHIKLLTDTLSYYLDQYGFTDTELIISETNINTGGYTNTSKGCSFLASELIATQGTRLSKFIWYRGVDLNPLCNEDVGSTASLTLNGYAYQFYNEVNDSTPLFLNSTGSEFDADNILDSLNNLMILSGKNATDDMVKVLVSNHESIYSDISMTVQNLSWVATDVIDVTIDKVTTAGFSTSSSTLAGASSIAIDLTAVTDASVFLITLKKQAVNSLTESESLNKELLLYPNPSSNVVYIKTDIINTTVVLTNAQGQQLMSEKNSSELDLSSIPNGLYFITVLGENGEIESSKMVVSKEN